MYRFTTCPGLVWLLLLLSVSSYAQTDGVSQVSPSLKITDPDAAKQVRISTLDIEVRVTGNMATTTMSMKFYNETNRLLEGELNFPLAEGQVISRFAMDVNGKLREGVTVEKAKGRQSFEEIIRRKIDPGLLEQTAGNSFKTRVYPLFAKNYKTVVIAYEQELAASDGQFRYSLPLDFAHPIDNFSIRVDVAAPALPPVFLQNPFSGLAFSSSAEGYTAQFAAEKTVPGQLLSFAVPVATATTIFTEKQWGVTHFYLTTTPAPQWRAKALPRTVCLLWDASHSARTRNMEKELHLLDTYFKKVKNVQVKFVAFHHKAEPEKVYMIADGNWQVLRKDIESLPYDGATQLGALQPDRYNCDEFILSSDGLSTFGNSLIGLSKTPVTVLCSSPAADYSALRYIAQVTAGAFINLNTIATTTADSLMLYQPYQFISATYGKAIRETYPSLPARVEGYFSLAGVMEGRTGEITLNYGFGNQVTYSEKIAILAPEALKFKSDEDSIAHAVVSVQRLWAKKKLAELDLQYEKNKEEISHIGKTYSLVTRNTSLIVLERIEDYFTYNITPPKELQDAYNRRFRGWNRQTNEQSMLEQVVREFEDLRSWWNPNYRQKYVAKEERLYKQQQKAREKQQKADQKRQEAYRKQQEIYKQQQEAYEKHEYAQKQHQYLSKLALLFPPVAPTGREYTVTGTVIAQEDGSTIPGVTVLVKGTTTGTVTDVEGRYKITVPAGSNTLVFSFVGMCTAEVQSNNTVVDIIMEDCYPLTEVVLCAAPSSQPIRQSLPEVKTGVKAEVLKINRTPGAAIELRDWNPKMPYLDVVSDVSEDSLYIVYLDLKKEYGASPGFYLDMCDYFIKHNQKELAIRILSNLAELEPESHELMRILAHRLQQLGESKSAVSCFERVVELREEEPQSYRDLALACAEDGQYQRAVDLLYKVALRQWNRRFDGINLVAVTEMNNIIALHREKIRLSGIDKRLVFAMPVDVRIVVNWSSDNCDINLHMVNPHGAHYGRLSTVFDGRISGYFTGGYGPEEFMLRKAVPGSYQVAVDYFNDARQTIAGPVTLQLQLFTHYGTPKQRKREITVRLTKSGEKIDIGKLVFK